MNARVAALLLLLLAGNAGAWLWAVALAHGHPLLMGAAVLAYTFGLRHAVDADHIAAIDNVTRKLLQQGRPASGTGTFFSLGHSTIVFALTVAIAAASSTLRDRLQAWSVATARLGTLLSATFLFLIAGANLLMLMRLCRTLRRLRSGVHADNEELDPLLRRPGLLGSVLRGVVRLVGRSWHMYLVGFLFGLGFDTATEIGLLGLSARTAAAGMPIWSILVFPTLFAAGMTLVDTADCLLMLGLYRWALEQPERKAWYNLALTSLSVAVAVVVGGIEVAGLL